MAKLTRAQTLLLGIIASILIGWVLHVGAPILKPLVIAFLLASLLQPFVILLARKGIPPALTVVLMVWLLFLGLVQAGLLLNANLQPLFRATQNGTVAEAPPAEGDDPEAEGGDGTEGEDTERPTDEEVGTGETGEPGDSDASTEPGESTETGESTEPGADEDGEASEATAGEEEEEEGVLDKVRVGQEEAIEQAGGWLSIISKLQTKIGASELDERLRKYAIQSLEQLKNETRPEDFVGGLALGGFGFLTNLVLVLIYMVFIFAEQAVFRRKILAVAGDRREEAAEVLDTIGRGIQRYLGVKTVVSFLTGALCTLVLVALEIPYAPLFGFLTFALNFIPTFGSIIAGIFPTVTAIAIGNDFTSAILIMITYLGVNLTLGSFIEPRILGRELNLSPLVVVVSVVVWGSLWGIVGAFLAVPLTSALQICMASQETTLPIAIMLGSGPPKERRKRRKGGDDEDEEGPSEVAA